MITLPFRKRQPAHRPSKVLPPHPKKEEVEKEVQEREEKQETKRGKIQKEIGKSLIAFRVLKEPRITEKGTRLEDQRQYVFKVLPQSNKNEIKRAIEEIYGVKVKKVNIVRIPRKKRRLGRQEGWKSGYKKAILTLKEGEKIEITPR
jgi:large subunit ribosomal protein L23